VDKHLVRPLGAELYSASSAEDSGVALEEICPVYVASPEGWVTVVSAYAVKLLDSYTPWFCSLLVRNPNLVWAVPGHELAADLVRRTFVVASAGRAKFSVMVGFPPLGIITSGQLTLFGWRFADPERVYGRGGYVQ